MRDDDGFPLFISNKLLASSCFSLKLFRQLTKLPKKKKTDQFLLHNHNLYKDVKAGRQKRHVGAFLIDFALVLLVWNKVSWKMCFVLRRVFPSKKYLQLVPLRYDSVLVEGEILWCALPTKSRRLCSKFKEEWGQSALVSRILEIGVAFFAKKRREKPI